MHFYTNTGATRRSGRSETTVNALGSFLPTPGHITSHFGLLFRLYYRYDVKNLFTTTIYTCGVYSKQLLPIAIAHSFCGIFYLSLWVLIFACI